MKTNINNDARLKAEKKVEALRGFYIHLLTYGLVSAGLLLLNYIYWNGYLWAAWPALGWGIGLACHGTNVHGKLWGDNWKERKIKKLLEKETTL
jgi:hypothetical protein